ncbi:MAG: acetyl-CoA carboxylase biotin carboxyl carrier protein [Alphaproteobacteria bacterium]
MNPRLRKGASARDAKTARAEIVRELAALLEDTGLNEIEIEQDGMRVRVARGAGNVVTAIAPDPGAPVKTVPSSAPSPKEPTTPHPGTVKSPMVGTVYVAPQPGAAPFVKVGDEVKEGQTLLIVEAMKTMNPIPAPRAGKILEIFIRDAQPVEFGEPLLVIG